MNKESIVKKPVCFIFKLIFIISISLPLFVAAEDLDMNKVRADEEFHYGVDAYHFGLYGKALQSFEKALSYQPDSELIKQRLRMVGRA